MEKYEVTEIESSNIRKQSRRFHPFKYLERYLPEGHAMFSERITLLMELIETYLKRPKGIRWARCCNSVERHVARGSLGHPEGQMVDLKDLLESELVCDEKSLRSFLLKKMPRNEDGDVLVPQINMMHGIICKEEPEDAEPEHMEKIEAHMILEDFDQNYSDLAEENKFLRQQNTELTSRLESMEGTLKVNHSYQTQAQQMAELTGRACKDEIIRKSLITRMKQIQEDLDPLLDNERAGANRFVPVMRHLDQNIALVEEYKKKMLDLEFKVQVLSDDSKASRKAFAQVHQDVSDLKADQLSSRITTMSHLGKRPPRS